MESSPALPRPRQGRAITPFAIPTSPFTSPPPFLLDKSNYKLVAISPTNMSVDGVDDQDVVADPAADEAGEQAATVATSDDDQSSAPVPARRRRRDYDVHRQKRLDIMIQALRRCGWTFQDRCLAEQYQPAARRPACLTVSTEV